MIGSIGGNDMFCCNDMLFPKINSCYFPAPSHKFIDFHGRCGETLEIECRRLEIELFKGMKHFGKLMKQKDFYYPASS